MIAGKSKRAPSLTLPEAENIIRAINSIAGTEPISEDSLPEIVNSSKTSSLFGRKLGALMNYGLINDTGSNKCVLSSLGMKIVTPTSEGEEDEARKHALLRIDLIQQLLNRFVGGNLPQDDGALKNVLQREYSIRPTHLSKWVAYIRTSFEILKPLLEDKSKTEDPQNGNQQENEQEQLPQSEKGSFNLQLPLSSGSIAKIIIPKGATVTDKEMIISIIDAVKFEEDDLLDD